MKEKNKTHKDNNLNNLNSLNKKPKESILLKQHSESFFEISFNKSKNLNSFDYEMTVRTLNHMKTIDSSETNHKKIVLYTSNVPKTFSTGGNLSALYFQKLKSEEQKIFTFYDNIIQQNIYALTTENLLFCIWDGYVMGGGVGISINCPIRISTENAVFSMPETSIGLYPDVGAGYFFPRIFNNNEALGLYAGLVGIKISAEACLKTGLSTHHINSRDIPELINSVKLNFNKIKNYQDLEDIVNKFCVFKYSKEIFYFAYENLLSKIFICDSLANIFMRLENEVKLIKIYLESKSPLDRDFIELQKELEFLEGIEKALKNCSPLSLFVYFEYFKLGKKSSHVLEVFKIDRILFHKMVYDSDFFNGIRAILVEKDRKPNWKFTKLSEIDKEKVYHHYFLSKEIIGKPKF
jgi:3-hydroxyisobutyryl-CoA hydrolase